MQREDVPRRGQEIVTKCRALHDTIRADADEIERLGRMTDRVVDGLREAGVFGMATPESMGGPEADPLTQLEVSEVLSISDASVGWIVTIASDTGYYAARLPEATAKEMFADPQTITASTLVPKGVARRVDGGYRVSGHWGFGSGGKHAAWFGGAVWSSTVAASRSRALRPTSRRCSFRAEKSRSTTTGTRRGSLEAVATTGASKTSSCRQTAGSRSSSPRASIAPSMPFRGC